MDQNPGAMFEQRAALDPVWEAAIVDIPRWVEARSLLLHGQAGTVGSPDGGFVLSRAGDAAAIVGTPDSSHARQATEGLTTDADLLVPPDSVEAAGRLFPGITLRRAILHRLAAPLPASRDPAVEIHQVDERFLSSLPPELATEAEGAFIAAVRKVDGMAVSMCGTSSITESLWDVGIDTLNGYRRRGHARECFLTLATHLRAKGREPVWGAYEDNHASLAMAASLGFRPVDELWVAERFLQRA
jgi:RimJ/RimL family protein N-acetyltransferase